MSDKTKQTLAKAAKQTESVNLKGTKQLYSNALVSQRQRILEAMRQRRNKGVSTFYCRGQLGTVSPAARILELKQAGNNIDKYWVFEPDQNQVIHRIACYVLVKEAY